MIKRIQYDDNIFFLMVMIRNLHDAIKLNVNAEYFASKILEDCLFINSIIQKIYTSLMENNNLIHGPTHLHSIMKTKVVYGKLLETILRTKDDYLTVFKPEFSEIKKIAADHLDDILIIKEKLSNLDGRKTDKRVISCDELHFLLSPIEERVES